MHLPVVLMETAWLPHDHYSLKVTAEFPLPPVGELAIALVEGCTTGTLMVQERTETLPQIGEVAKMLTLARVAVVERDEVEGRPYAKATLLTAPDELEPADLEPLRKQLKAASRQLSSQGRKRDWFELMRTRDPEELLDRLGAETPRSRDFLEAHSLADRLALALEWMEGLLQAPEEPEEELADDEPLPEHVHPLDELAIFEGAMQDCGPMAGAARCRPNPCLAGDVLVLSVLKPGAVFGFSREGEVLWQKDLEVWDAPCPLGARVLVCTGEALFCLEAATGEELWSFRPCGEEGHWLYGSPRVHEDRVFLGDRQGLLHCLNADDGEKVWSAPVSPGEDVNATPLVCDGLVLAASNSGQLVALHAGSGKPAWKATLDGPCADTLQVYDERVLMSTTRSLYLYHPTRGRVAQRWHWPRCRIAGYCVFPDRLLVVRQTAERAELVGIQGREEVFCVPASPNLIGLATEPALGLAWEIRTDGLMLVDPVDGRRVHGFAPPESLARPDTPLVLGDTAYVWTGAGTLWALDMLYLLEGPPAAGAEEPVGEERVAEEPPGEAVAEEPAPEEPAAEAAETGPEEPAPEQPGEEDSPVEEEPQEQEPAGEEPAEEEAALEETEGPPTEPQEPVEEGEVSDGAAAEGEAEPGQDGSTVPEEDSDT